MACGTAQGLGLPQRLRRDVRDRGDANVDERDLVRVARRDVQRLASVRDLVGGHALGRDQARGGARDRRLPHLRERIVGTGGQRQQRGVPDLGRGGADGAVSTEHDDHCGATRPHGPDQCPRVVGGAGQRAQLDELGRGEAARARAAPRQAPGDATRDPHAVGGHERPLDACGPGGGEQPEHHIRLLGVREDRGLRDETADVAAGHRVRDDPDRRPGATGSHS
jgi:hypothetical protein